MSDHQFASFTVSFVESVKVTHNYKNKTDELSTLCRLGLQSIVHEPPLNRDGHESQQISLEEPAFPVCDMVCTTYMVKAQVPL
jgi:hypothetical protein